MSAAVQLLRLREVLSALALIGALSGIIGMHHVLASGSAGWATATPAAAAQHPAPDVTHAPAAAPADDGDHDGHGPSDLLHLCLAVLAASLCTVIALVLLRRGLITSTTADRRAPKGSTGSRAPPIPVPCRLALLCVLRT